MGNEFLCLSFLFIVPVLFTYKWPIKISVECLLYYFDIIIIMQIAIWCSPSFSISVHFRTSQHKKRTGNMTNWVKLNSLTTYISLKLHNRRNQPSSNEMLSNEKKKTKKHGRLDLGPPGSVSKHMDSLGWRRFLQFNTIYYIKPQLSL